MSAAPTRLVLASASASRRAVLANAGVAAAIDPASIDEVAVKRALMAAGESASAAAERLAELKALAVAPRHPGALVLGCDQMLECEGTWYDKPAGRDGAARQLAALAGRTHVLWSAVVAVRDGSRRWRHVEAARMTMRPLSDRFVADYLDAVGEAACASVGGYQLEGRGAQLFERVQGDFFTILGLPLLPLLGFLRAERVLPE